MKKGIHPENYRLVAFKAGRVDKFMSRYAKRYDKKNAK